MRKWLHDHSLTIGLLAIYFTFQALAAVSSAHPFDQEYWQAMFQGHADDTWGALAIVLFTKWWREKGSKESK